MSEAHLATEAPKVEEECLELRAPLEDLEDRACLEHRENQAKMEDQENR